MGRKVCGSQKAVYDFMRIENPFSCWGRRRQSLQKADIETGKQFLEAALIASR